MTDIITTLVAAARLIERNRPDWKAAVDYPSFLAIELPDGRMFVTGDANPTYTVDAYANVRAFEDGTPSEESGFDLGLSVDATGHETLAAALINVIATL